MECSGLTGSISHASCMSWNSGLPFLCQLHYWNTRYNLSDVRLYTNISTNTASTGMILQYIEKGSLGKASDEPVDTPGSVLYIVL